MAAEVSAMRAFMIPSPFGSLDGRGRVDGPMEPPLDIRRRTFRRPTGDLVPTRTRLSPMTAHTEPSVRVDLAHEPDFRLGELLLRPSSCVARTAGRERRLEPRVMEVLVLLARAANHTVTRDDLIEACWGGRFVSDDAITRVIGKVRAVARGVEPAPFVLETVPKVGFRLITPSQD